MLPPIQVLEGPRESSAPSALSRAALAWARLMAEGKAAGRARSALDMIIAATAEANDCLVVTDNEKDFAGLKIVNPLRRTVVRERVLVGWHWATVRRGR